MGCALGIIHADCQTWLWPRRSRTLASILFPIFSIAHLAIVIWLVAIWRSSPKAQVRCACAIAAVVTAGLVYDNGLIALGAQIGLGPQLEVLSMPRYVLHALVTPLMIFAMLQLAAAADIKLAQRRWARWAAGILSIALIPVGIEEGLIGLELYPACFEGTVRYASSSYANQLCSPTQAVVAATGGPPIPAITVVLVMLILGSMILYQRRSPWALLGGIVMLIGAGVPIANGPVPGNGGEVVLTLSYALTAARFSKNA